MFSPSAIPTPTVSYGPGYQQSLKTAVTLPSKWAGGGGWAVADPSAGVFGLKHSVAVVPKAWTGSLSSPVHTLATVATYDRNGRQIDASKVPSGMSSSKLSGVFSGASYYGGKAYLIIAQYGYPAGSDGAAKPSAVHYVVIEDESGKIVADSVFTAPEPLINTDGKVMGVGGIRADNESMWFMTTNSTYVINPSTGAVDTITAPSQEYRWMKRVDGVDIFQKGMAGGLSGAGWQIPETMPFTAGGYSDPNKVVPAFGPYLSVGDKCQRTIDVHTGATAPGFEKTNGQCSWTNLFDKGNFYRGVVSNGTSYLRPADGALYQASEAEPLYGPFAGADGIIYGNSGPSTRAGDHLDLSEGAAKAESPAGAVAPLAVTADGLAVFMDSTDGMNSNGYLIVNPVTE